MTPEILNHLGDESLNDVLIGLGSLESDAHLARCPECRSKVENFRADMTVFNSASMAWSESRSESRTGRQVEASPRRTAPRIRFAFVGWSAAAALVLITAMTLWHHTGVAPLNHVNILESQTLDSETQIAQDNELLQEINAAIGADDEFPIQEYNLRERPHSRLKPQSQ
jgi:hypothetical protein